MSPLERRPAAGTPEAQAQLGLAYRVLEPQGGAEPQPAGGRHPTALLLHGMGGDERVMWVFAPQLPPHWLLVAPRAPLPAAQGGWAWLPRQPDEWPDLARFEAPAATLDRFLRGLPEHHPVDLNRLLLIGFSQGAATAFALTLRLAGQGPAAPRPRGIASLVGFVPDGALEAFPSQTPLAGLPTFIAVGQRDPLVPLAHGRAAAETARALGADLRYHEYEAGHKMPARGMLDLAEWCRGLGI